MTKINKKINRLAVSVAVVLCLLVSSVSACCCDHSTVKAETEIPSCHAQNEHPAEVTNNSAAIDDSAGKRAEKEDEKTDFGKKINAPCECLFEYAPKATAKAENVKKTQKHQAIYVARPEAIRGFVHVRAPSAQRFDFQVFQCFDSFYNIKSPRAPPTHLTRS